MKKGMIGVQMMMLKGKVDEIGVYETMRKISELGFHCAEVSQIPMTPENVEELKKASKDFDIKIAAISASLEPMYPGAPGESLTNDFGKIVSDCKTLDCDFLRIGMLPFSMMGSKEKTLAFVQRAEEMAARLEEHGIHLYYHNHHVEFEKYDGELMLDIMKDTTSKVGFELDVHWIHRGGENPVEFVKKYAGRVSLLHLKDYRVGRLDASKLNFEDMTNFMRDFTNVIQFAEVGEGTLDFKSIIPAGLESGSKYFFIEQDDTYGRDPFESLKISADNLRKLGFADWF